MSKKAPADRNFRRSRMALDCGAVSSPWYQPILPKKMLTDVVYAECPLLGKIVAKNDVLAIVGR